MVLPLAVWSFPLFLFEYNPIYSSLFIVTYRLYALLTLIYIPRLKAKIQTNFYLLRRIICCQVLLVNRQLVTWGI